MSLRVGFLGIAHMHAWGYVSALRSCDDARVVAVWDPETPRKDAFALENGLHQAESPEDLLGRVDAVVITSPNKSHVEHAAMAAAAGKAILCEKPLVTCQEESKAMRAVEGKTLFMTAFPCRLSPNYRRLKERLASGDIGPIQAICATNRGRCPGGWFVDVTQSGGGAMMDHTVHVADLLRDLLEEEPSSVDAQVGSNLYEESWEDTAMLTLQYPSGVFATLDASWSRPNSFKTWGDVTMNVVGETGVIEMEMFGQEIDVWTSHHAVAGYGSNLDLLLVREWISAIREQREPEVTLEDGLAASEVAIRAYESAQPALAYIRREDISP